MTNDSTLLDLLDALRRQWKILLLVFLPMTLGGVLYAESLPSEYTATAVVAFSPAPGEDVGADVITLVLPKYAVLVGSTASVTEVAEPLGLDPGELDDALSARVPPDTATLEITVTSSSPRIAAAAADEFAERANAYARTDPLLDASIVAEASIPSAPSGPPRMLLEIAISAAALLIGAAVAVVVEKSRPRLRSVSDLSVLPNQRVIGSLPRSRRARTRPFQALDDPAVGSAVRALRTAIDRISQSAPVQVLCVTSAVSGEGKTTLSALLAEGIARLKADVLLIDADLAKGGLTRAAGVANDVGIIEVLKGQKPLAEATTRLADRISILTARVDPGAGDLLATGLGDVLRQAATRFDVVVVDAAPVVGTDTGTVAAALADGVLLVLAAGTPSALAVDAAAVLEAADAKVLGVVGNRLRVPSHFYTY